MKDFPVDAGMIGILPMAAVNRGEDCFLSGGLVVKVRRGQFLNLRYKDGRIEISAADAGALFVGEDTEYWVGDPCYVLENNIPIENRDWDKSKSEALGYWAAAVSSLETPRDGEYVAEPYPLADSLQGLVSRTQWGDGLYPSWERYCNGYFENIVIQTGDDDDEEE